MPEVLQPDRQAELLDLRNRLIYFIALPIWEDEFGSNHGARRAHREKLPAGERVKFEQNKFRMTKISFVLGCVSHLGEQGLVPSELVGQAEDIWSRIRSVTQIEFVPGPNGRRTVDPERSQTRSLYDEMGIEEKMGVVQEVTRLAVAAVLYLTQEADIMEQK